MFSNGSPPGKKSGGSINRGKRNKRNGAWGSRERAGMSFLIVVAFFAVFGLIILTEVCFFHNIIYSQIYYNLNLYLDFDD